MKKILIILIILALALFLVPTVPYYDCSKAMPSIDAGPNWVKENCEKNKRSIYRWYVNNQRQEIF